MALSGATRARNRRGWRGFFKSMRQRRLRYRSLHPAIVLLPLLLLALACSAIAAPALDRRFGDEGVVRTPLPESLRFAIARAARAPLIEDLAPQRGGKMVAALASGGRAPYLGAARYRLDGSLDRGFGIGGFARTDRYFRGLKGEAQAQAVAVQRDRKILIAGHRGSIRANASIAPVLARLRPNGRPDRSFGSGGLVAPRPREKDGVALYGVTVQRNGRIVAVGARNERSGGRPAGLAIAYRPDGRIDRRFGRNGRVAFPHRRVGDGYTALRDIAVLRGGKMLVVGFRGERLFVARLRPNGALDRSFGGGDGKVAIARGASACCSGDAALRVLPGGSIVVLQVNPLFGWKLARLRPSGALERGFGRGGIASFIRPGKLFEPRGMAVQGNGRIVVVGASYGDHKSNHKTKLIFAIHRVLPNGKPDRGFGRRGAKRLPVGHESIGGAALTLPDGSVVTGGGAQLLRPPGGEDRFEYELVLARLSR